MRHELHQMLTNGKMARMLGIDSKTLRKWARRGYVRSYLNPLNGYRYFFKIEVIQDLKKVPGSKKAQVDQRLGRR